MGHSQTEKAASHARIVDIAARRFRERGFEAVGVADLMAEAGLTHGGFYKHFPSRDALVTEATERAFADAWQHWKRFLPEGKGADLEAVLRYYLTESHREDRERGCPIAALMVDTWRTPAAQQVFRENFRTFATWLSSKLGETGEDAVPRAAAVIAAMAGTIAIARALDDDELSLAMLESTRELVLKARTEQGRNATSTSKRRRRTAAAKKTIPAKRRSR
jgi:TetR/AcrR family transcriptional regulator, transcriptional repressor for nem operon